MIYEKRVHLEFSKTKLSNHDNFGLGSVLESGPNKKAKYAHTSIASTPA